jgi:Family of unknown function (DUF6493)
MKHFSPQTALEEAVYAGTYDRALSLLRVMNPKERKAQRSSVVRMASLLRRSRFSPDGGEWGSPPTRAQVRAAAAAVILCGTATDAAQHFDEMDDLIALAREFQPPSLEGLGEAMLARSPRMIGFVQPLIAAGIIHRPQSPSYAIGLIGLPATLRSDGSIDRVLGADPGLKDELLSIMEVEGTSEFNLAAVDKYSHEDRCWDSLLLKLCRQGVYSRATLLDKTLSALERDWPQFRAGWFSRFHERLAPSIEEMRPHWPRYLALCGSRIPPTVSFALEALGKLQIETPQLLEALRPVMSSNVAAHITGALKLLDARIKAQPGVAAMAAEIVVPALAHNRADIQAQVLQRLQRWGADAELQKQIRALAPLVAAVNRKPLQELCGGESADVAVSTAPLPIAPRKVAPLDPARRLPPIDSFDECIERVAYVFENDTDVDEFERVIAALLRLAPLGTRELERLGPVIKRATKVQKLMARELARLLLFVFDGSRRLPAARRDYGGRPIPVERLLIARIDGLIEVAAQGKRLEPLSSPTHQRGFIDPAVFVARVRTYQNAEIQAPLVEQELGLLRLTPAASEDLRSAARTLRDDVLARALRYALGDSIEPGSETRLFAAAARIRCPGTDDPAMLKRHGDLGPDGSRAAKYSWGIKSWETQSGPAVDRFEVQSSGVPELTAEFLAVQRHPPDRDHKDRWWRTWSFAGIDEGAIRYSSTLLPSSLEAFFAEGARYIGNNIDWWEAQWQNRAYLQPLCDPTVEIKTTGAVLLALGLAGKEPGQTAIAIDGLAQAAREQRVDVQLLGTILRDLQASGTTKSSRYAKSLQAALRIDPAISACVIDLLETMLEASPEAPPRDTAMLLALLQETAAATQAELSAPAREAIARLKLSGKGRALQEALLRG